MNKDFEPVKRGNGESVVEEPEPRQDLLNAVEVHFSDPEDREAALAPFEVSDAVRRECEAEMEAGRKRGWTTQ
jgi:hypothetical protein